MFNVINCYKDNKLTEIIRRKICQIQYMFYKTNSILFYKTDHFNICIRYVKQYFFLFLNNTQTIIFFSLIMIIHPEIKKINIQFEFH